MTNNPNQKGAAQLLLLLSAVAVIAILGLSSFSSLQDKLLSALGRKTDSYAATETDTSFNLGVLELKYFPLTPNGQNIDINITGDVGEPYQLVRQRTIDASNNLLQFLPKATKYLGYKDPSAQPALNYSIVDSKEYTQAVPIQSGSTNKPDFMKILTDHNICDYVDNRNVREVWIWAYQGPGPHLAISESQLTGPVANFSNGPYYNAPVCNNTYRILTFNYQRGTSEAMHSWGHQIEFELAYVDNPFFKNIFQGSPYPPVSGTTGRCGSVHNPPNSRGEYDWENPNPHRSDCLDWNPDSLGTLTDISCHTWGCQNISDSNNASLNYFVWMWQNLPGRNNTKTYQGKPLRNWWEVHGDFDNFIRDGRKLTLPVLTQFSPKPPGSNVALSAAVSSSSNVNVNGWNRDNVVDGQTNSMPSSLGWTSDSNLGVSHTEWIRLDFGGEYMINQVKLYPRSDSPGLFFPIDFKIETSADGTNFTVVVDKQNYPNPGATVQVFSFNPVNARFVRLTATKLMMAEGSSHRVQLAEIEVFNTTTPSPSPSPIPSFSPSPAISPSPSPRIPGDIVAPFGKVDIFDYNQLLTDFAKIGSNLLGDIDGNERVDIFDYNQLLTNFGLMQ